MPLNSQVHLDGIPRSRRVAGGQLLLDWPMSTLQRRRASLFATPPRQWRGLYDALQSGRQRISVKQRAIRLLQRLPWGSAQPSATRSW